MLHFFNAHIIHTVLPSHIVVLQCRLRRILIHVISIYIDAYVYRGKYQKCISNTGAISIQCAICVVFFRRKGQGELVRESKGIWIL